MQGGQRILPPVSSLIMVTLRSCSTFCKNELGPLGLLLSDLLLLDDPVELIVVGIVGDGNVIKLVFTSTFQKQEQMKPEFLN